MKYILTLFLVISFVANSFSQGKEASCLDAYIKAFNERGAYPVEDGTYKNVIISVVNQKTGETDCFSGKVKVENTFVTAMYMMYEDGTYEYIDRKWKNENKSKINNGITEALVTDTGEKYYVVFTEKIKPKKKQYKKVTGPDKNF
jgi:hypothetical protein